MHQSMSSEGQKGQSRTGLRAFRDSTVRAKVYRAMLTGLKLLVGLALLAWSIRDIQYQNLLAGIKSADLAWLSLAGLLVVVGLGIKYLRWRILIKNYGIRGSFARLFSAYFVGQATNIILPLRGGELVRLGYFAGKNDLLPRAASTIVLEKYLDLLALTVCGLLVSLTISLDDILNWRGWLLPVTIGLSLLLLSAILFGPALWNRIRQRNLLSPPVTLWIDRWVQASCWLRHPAQLIPAILSTILIWTVMWLTNLLLFKSLAIPLGASAGGLVLVLVYIGLLPALMPGNIGPFYFFARLAVVPFGIIQSQSIVFAVILHAIVTLPPLLCGAIGLLLTSTPPSST